MTSLDLHYYPYRGLGLHYMNFVRVSDSVCNRWRGLARVIKVAGRHRNGQVAALPSPYPKGSQWVQQVPEWAQQPLGSVPCHVLPGLCQVITPHPSPVLLYSITADANVT